MFRRREEGLFDTDMIDENAPEESATVITPAAASTQGASTSSSAASTTAANPITRPSAAVPPAAANAATTPTTSFRTSGSAPYNAPAANADVARPRTPEGAKPLSAFSAQAAGSKSTGNRVLTVGHDILLKGEINSCDRLVIEGKLEATLNDVHTIELAQIGSFKGSANVVEAEISGTFEGDLVVTGRLVIYASGKVSGKVTYGEVEIERGGELTGEIKSVGTSQSAPKSLRQKEAA